MKTRLQTQTGNHFCMMIPEAVNSLPRAMVQVSQLTFKSWLKLLKKKLIKKRTTSNK